MPTPISAVAADSKSAAVVPLKARRASTRAAKKEKETVEAGPIDTSRNHLDWSVKEDEKILDSVMVEGSKTTIFDLARKFKKDALLVAKHVLDTELPEMVGFSVDAASEEEAEFLGLVLGGAPIALALQWCASCEEHEDRPTSAMVQASLSRGDFRVAMNLVRETGIWFSGLEQLEYLVLLQDMDPLHVRQAVSSIVDRIDAPHPQMVFEQLCGLFEGEEPADWDLILLSAPSKKKSRYPSSKKSTTTTIHAGQSAKSRRARSSSSSTTTRRRKSSTSRSYSGFAKKKRSWGSKKG